MATKPKSPKKPRTPRPPRPRQAVLPGGEEPYIPAVTEAVVAFIEARDRKKDADDEMKAARLALAEIMKQHNLPKYVTPEKLVATYELREKVGVKRPKGVQVNGEA